MEDSKLAEELKALEERDGVLKPESVVDFAQDPSTALHSKFTWDDTVAGREHRLWQARQIIRAVVTVLNTGKEEVRTHAFVHIEGRDGHENGYHSISRVLSDEEMKAIMLKTALKELQTFKKKYANLKELSSIFEAIDKI